MQEGSPDPDHVVQRPTTRATGVREPGTESVLRCYRLDFLSAGAEFRAKAGT